MASSDVIVVAVGGDSSVLRLSMYMRRPQDCLHGGVYTYIASTSVPSCVMPRDGNNIGVPKISLEMAKKPTHSQDNQQKVQPSA
jgi:hypothetical protein